MVRASLMGFALLCACAPSDLEEASAGFTFSAEELDTQDRIDAYRFEQGLPALEADPLLGELARAHSEAMLSGEVPFSHDGFNEERLPAMVDAGYTRAGENVAVNSGFDDPVGVAVQGWLDSPDHHENIVSEWTHTGVGIATDGEQYYFTQLFGYREDEAASR